MALWECQSHLCRVISTLTVPYNTPLVWYVHFIFYSAQLQGLGSTICKKPRSNTL